MVSTLGDMIWTAQRVYRHKRRVRQMLDPRAYERHGRSRWLPDASYTRRLELAQAVAAVVVLAANAALVAAWFAGVI